jgi:uncharacterized protein YecE (DUF72 family)
MLRYYARSFSTVEIDSSYYGVPTVRTIAAMVSRTPPAFRLSFKAPQTVTHPADPASLNVHDDAKLLAENLQPALSAGKLACVLLQFPNAFAPEGNREEYVARAARAFAGIPVVVEFRNRRWQRAQTLRMLRDIGAGYCNVDMPALAGLLRPSSEVTGEIGYVRFHGRNAKAWWRGTNVTRYEYLYAMEELEPWADRIAEIDARARATYVYFNNHAAGRAPKNAGMLLALLGERYGDRAASIIAHAGPSGGDDAPALPGMHP